jgi:hypothetical protein
MFFYFLTLFNFVMKTILSFIFISILYALLIVFNFHDYNLLIFINILINFESLHWQTLFFKIGTA